MMLNENSRMVDEGTVKAWLEAVANRIRANTAEMARLESEIVADRRREAALRALLAASENGVKQREPQEESDSPTIAVGRQPQRVSVHPIEQGAIEILEDRGKPVHISELRAELARRGIPIPGKGTDANVIVYLAAAPQICRVGRGLYALRGWGVPEVPPRRRRSSVRGRRSRRRRSLPARAKNVRRSARRGQTRDASDETTSQPGGQLAAALRGQRSGTR
jgi:hypothetical protein